MRKITRDRGYPGEDNFTDQSQSIDLIKSTSEEVTIILHRRDSKGNASKISRSGGISNCFDKVQKTWMGR